MEPGNLIGILSVEHVRDASGCNWNAVLQIPNLDRLAAQGTRFSAARTTCCASGDLLGALRDDPQFRHEGAVIARGTFDNSTVPGE